ncbi:MAG: CotH kinase family protein [Ignavibacteriales bacterium]|nr:CotH kinase family protein [Ignavibacteriales bacterium]
MKDDAKHNRLVEYISYYYLVGMFFFTICAGEVFSQNIFINELMPSNSVTIKDEDGEFSDWIELYNSSVDTISLLNYGLSDDSTDKFKWVFPEVQLIPQDYIYLFASAKDRYDFANHWEAIIDKGDNWRYYPAVTAPPSNWRYVNFDDQSWQEGPSGFGYGDGDDSTITSNVIAVFIRKKFNIEDITNIKYAILHVDYDDGFVAYLNGVEIARANIGTPGFFPAWNQWADNAIEPFMYQGLQPPSYYLPDIESLLLPGENILSIEVHNYGTSSSDLTLIPFLTLGMVNPPAEPRGTSDLLEFHFPMLHTNFKLDSQGGGLFLTSPLGGTADSIIYSTMPTDISLGRFPDGSINLNYFTQPTPGQSNSTLGYTTIASPPSFSQAGGFYPGPLTLNLSSQDSGAMIYYTTDGSIPGDTSNLYVLPINILQTSAIRAVCYLSGALPSKTITNSYIINFETQLPVVSISTAPFNLWDDQWGIYVLGDSAESSYPYFGANFWQDWERPIHIEMFEPDGSAAFSEDAGVKIFGNWSRGQAQKSLAVFMRDSYGDKEINYKIFDDKPISSFESIVLRNAGNDWGYSIFRDGLMQTLVKDIGIDHQAYRPAVLFLNGEYWGIHNIREKVNETFIADNNNVNPDSIDLLELDGSYALAGSNFHYQNLLNFLETKDITVASNYDSVKMMMDISNFIRYEVSEIYFDNTDWPGNNIKFWRPQTAGGKWRWILFDTDFGFGLFDQNAYRHNTLAFALEDNGPGWPNPPWSTFLLRTLTLNSDFRNEFINTFADHLNSTFLSERVINLINEFRGTLLQEMARHKLKWPESAVDWENNIEGMRQFSANRIVQLRGFIMDEFNLQGMGPVFIQSSYPGAGKIKINSIFVDDFPWFGQYFYSVSIKIKAIPNFGFKFVRWEGDVNSTETEIDYTLISNLNLTAVFEIDSTENPLVINEINYSSSADFNTEDWIEIYNNTSIPVDLSNWIIKDSDDSHEFIIPSGVQISSDDYLIICRDTAAFKILFPDVKNVIGDLGFGLSSTGDIVRLFDNSGNAIDSVQFDDEYPWPTEPNGNGPTLSLKNPNFDNSLAGSWAASSGHGTPGEKNDVYVTSLDEQNLEIPDQYFLSNNYPNPFNPATFINYQIPEKQFVEIKVYDVLGKEVASLVEQELPPGFYTVRFDASQLSSGVYFYRMKAGDFNITKKLLLVK